MDKQRIRLTVNKAYQDLSSSFAAELESDLREIRPSGRIQRDELVGVMTAKMMTFTVYFIEAILVDLFADDPAQESL